MEEGFKNNNAVILADEAKQVGAQKKFKRLQRIHTIRKRKLCRSCQMVKDITINRGPS